MSNFISNCFLPWLLIKTVTGQMPAAKYIMGGMPGRPLPSLPSVPIPYPTNPTISSILNTYLPTYSNVQNPFNIPTIPPAMMPSPQINPLAFPIPTQPSTKQSPTNFFDSTAMNNLAIALHLLILTNLLHSEPEPQKPPAAEPAIPQSSATYSQNPQPQNQALPYPQPVQYTQEPQETQSFTPPNSKFLTSSGFVEPPMSSLIAPIPGYGNTQNSNPRNNYSLMSPYEALGPGPQGKDVFAQYGPQNLKADFQSPYKSIMAHDNMF